MTTMHWYWAHLRWAIMVEGAEGLRHWEEAVHIFRAENWETAFQQALNRGYQQESWRQKEGWRHIQKRFVAVLTLDSMGANPWHFQVDLGARKANIELPFEHFFQPEKNEPAPFF
jgi:hypothetical protein